MQKPLQHITTIAFDADDTLWVNETYFRAVEHEFAKLLAMYETENKIDQELFKVEMKNLPLYGYGVKGFVLSMIESAIELSNGKISNTTILKIIEFGRNMLNKPVELLEGVEQVLEKLSKSYRLLVLTKGDLLDQERKLEKSNLSKYFHHVEVMSDKKEDNYTKLLAHLQIDISQFLMVGNSLKSDVLPIVNIGGSAIHVPFHTTWIHEQVKDQTQKDKYITVKHINEILNYL